MCKGQCRDLVWQWQYRCIGHCMKCSLRTLLHLIPSGKRSEEHTSELQSPCNLVCRLLLEKKKRGKSLPDCSSNGCASTAVIAQWITLRLYRWVIRLRRCKSKRPTSGP